jgi:hypothetical protein
MPGVKIALAVGLTFTAVALGVVLATPPVAVHATNSVPPGTMLAEGIRGVCQAGERMPRGTRSIRVSLYAFTGPRVTVKAIGDGRVLASGEIDPGWSGASITIPVHPAPSANAADVTVCLEAQTIGEPIVAYGGLSPKRVAARTLTGEALPGRLSIQFVGEGHSTWLTLASAVARHMSLGRAWSGVWVVFLVAALMLTAGALTVRLVLRELQ